ncbi:MAG: MerR family transcriptional regulator [Dermatophilaceae bacterium]|jgi:DNA-binding transcriptional MerR regulator
MTAYEQGLTVGQVAERFGVTVRTLHHYDEIGLLTPSERTSAGYRVYTHDDLARLRTIVVYRRLEFGLDDVRALLDGDASVADHLRRQRVAVQARMGELAELVAAIDRALESHMSDSPMTDAQMRELFGDSFSEDDQAEAEQRWGATDAWAQSASRTAKFTRQDWEAVKAEQQAVGEAFAAAMDAGLSPTSDEAMVAAELHRASISRFYDCSYDMQCALAEMYLADPRFTATYEAQRVGMAAYVHDAIKANAARHR